MMRIGIRIKAPFIVIDEGQSRIRVVDRSNLTAIEQRNELSVHLPFFRALRTLSISGVCRLTTTREESDR
jgi:hypothetical protein